MCCRVDIDIRKKGASVFGKISRNFLVLFFVVLSFSFSLTQLTNYVITFDNMIFVNFPNAIELGRCRKPKKQPQHEQRKLKHTQQPQLPRPQQQQNHPRRLRKVHQTSLVTLTNYLWDRRKATMTTTKRKCQLEAKDWSR